MKEYTVRRLCFSVKGDYGSVPDAVLDRTVAGVSTDSRSIRPGDVFFAIKGDRFDGADYIETALKKGALLAVTNKDSMKAGFAGLPVISVEDTIRALGDAARDCRSLFRKPVVAVTGTSGKTTAKEMMLAVLRTTMNAHGTSGNYNNHIGLPLSIFGLRDEHDCAVFELGMSAAGEIRHLAGIAKPDIGVVLNVGPAHMEFFPSLEAVADAKMELVEALNPGGTAVVNGDDTLLKQAGSRCRCRLLTFGIESSADFKAADVQIGGDGCAEFTVEGNRVRLSIPGSHSVSNALAAYTVGSILGVDGAVAAKALETVTAPGMRMQIVEKHGVRYINDSYNANPMSMKGAANVLRQMAPSNGGRKIAILGTMLELGDFATDAHYIVGTQFGILKLEWLCLVGDHANDYMRGALESGMNPDRIRFFESVDSAAAFVDEERKAGDIILVKGSRGMKMEKMLAH